MLGVSATVTRPPSLPPRLREALERVIDPESGLNIVDMGLVEGLHDDADALRLRLVMTSAACPMAGLIAEDAEAELLAASSPGRVVEVQVLDTPAWTPERLTAAGRQQLGWAESDGSARAT
jgi:metal-sulfur cluster biosynthetic enzyme